MKFVYFIMSSCHFISSWLSTFQLCQLSTFNCLTVMMNKPSSFIIISIFSMFNGVSSGVEKLFNNLFVQIHLLRFTKSTFGVLQSLKILMLVKFSTISSLRNIRDFETLRVIVIEFITGLAFPTVMNWMKLEWRESFKFWLGVIRVKGSSRVFLSVQVRTVVQPTFT